MSLKQTLQSFIQKSPAAHRVYNTLRQLLLNKAMDSDSISQQLQKVLINQYNASLREGKKPYSNISDAGFRCYSQFEEDGILLYILSVIGMKSKKVVEICCGIGVFSAARVWAFAA